MLALPRDATPSSRVFILSDCLTFVTSSQPNDLLLRFCQGILAVPDVFGVYMMTVRMLFMKVQALLQ